MKIVYLEPIGKGGMIHYAFQLCRALAAQGADVTLITSQNYELAHLDAPFRVEAILDLWDPKPKSDSRFRKLRRIPRAIRHYREWLRQIQRVEELQPDAVLVGDIRFSFDLFPLQLLRKKTRVLAEICHNVGARPLFDRIYALFDVVFVHFERNRARFLELFDAREVVTIVHGNEEIFRELRSAVTPAMLRARHNIGDDPVVLFFGAFSHYKGIDVLLDAFTRVTGAKLVLAGFPLDVHPTSGDAIWVTEYIDSSEVAAWMELASVVVFPYRDISQSGALHVAQTFGVPIVASRVGAFEDVIEHEVSGLLVPPEDPVALADAITRLLRDRPFAMQLGAQAAQDAREKFAWSRSAAAIAAALDAHS